MPSGFMGKCAKAGSKMEKESKLKGRWVRQDRSL
jgi:hypothetical protein